MIAVVRVRTIFTTILPGLVVGVVLAAVATSFLIGVEWRAMKTTVNGWTTLPECGKVGINILEQAVCADPKVGLPAANVPREAVYWVTYVDGAGRRLDGRNDYRLRFPPGGLPPNGAFWSLTMYTMHHTFVSNPIDRYEVSDQSGLSPNADGSIDVDIQNRPPTSHVSNWLPAPAGRFLLFLRVYLPGRSILNGTFRVPPVDEAR